MSSSCRVLLWVPESDYDKDAVCCIAKKIVEFYKCELQISYATKQAFNDVTRKPGGLQKAVNTYLKTVDSVIFLLDSDGTRSQSQRRRESNSLFNQIQQVVSNSEGKAKLIQMVQELEAWLLVDCLGICCYFTKNSKNRNDDKWFKFCRNWQQGKTNLITEAELGGKSAKQYLEKFSEEILIKQNPNLKNKYDNLNQNKYRVDQSPAVAEYIEINNITLNRNDSLIEFAEYLKQLAESKENLDDIK